MSLLGRILRATHDALAGSSPPTSQPLTSSLPLDTTSRRFDGRLEVRGASLSHSTPQQTEPTQPTQQSALAPWAENAYMLSQTLGYVNLDVLIQVWGPVTTQAARERVRALGHNVLPHDMSDAPADNVVGRCVACRLEFAEPANGFAVVYGLIFAQACRETAR